MLGPEMWNDWFPVLHIMCSLSVCLLFYFGDVNSENEFSFLSPFPIFRYGCMCIFIFKNRVENNFFAHNSLALVDLKMRSFY